MRIKVKKMKKADAKARTALLGRTAMKAMHGAKCTPLTSDWCKRHIAKEVAR